MKTPKLSLKRLVVVQILIRKAAEIMFSIYGTNLEPSQLENVFTSIYKTAKKSTRFEWEYNCQEVVLNLTR